MTDNQHERPRQPRAAGCTPHPPNVAKHTDWLTAAVLHVVAATAGPQQPHGSGLDSGSLLTRPPRRSHTHSLAELAAGSQRVEARATAGLAAHLPFPGLPLPSGHSGYRGGRKEEEKEDTGRDPKRGGQSEGVRPDSRF